MSWSRIIVMVLIFALSLSGWVGQAQALGNLSFDVPASTGGPEGHADEADCPGAAASKSHHDHSHADGDTHCCHLVAPALELCSPSSDQTSWSPATAVLPSCLESITGIIVSPVLRPPRA